MRKSSLTMAAASAIFALAAADVAAAGTYASQDALFQRAVVTSHDAGSSYGAGGEIRLEKVQNRRSSRCRQVRRKHKRNGTVIGALTGGFLGSQVAGRGARTEGMLIGAGLGAVTGRQIGKSNARRRC